MEQTQCSSSTGGKDCLNLHRSTCSLYDPSFPLNLSCDASPVRVGAVIFYTLPDNTEKVIAYASCELSQAKKNYVCSDSKGGTSNNLWSAKNFPVPPWTQILFDN